MADAMEHVATTGASAFDVSAATCGPEVVGVEDDRTGTDTHRSEDVGATGATPDVVMADVRTTDDTVLVGADAAVVDTHRSEDIVDTCNPSDIMLGDLTNANGAIEVVPCSIAPATGCLEDSDMVDALAHRDSIGGVVTATDGAAVCEATASADDAAADANGAIEVVPCSIAPATGCLEDSDMVDALAHRDSIGGVVTATGGAAVCEATASADDAAAANLPGSDGENEDEVVQECDIFLNRMYDPPDFVGDMYVLQYPLRPIYRPYGDQGDLERIDLKPIARRLRVVHKLHNNQNYDDDGVMSEKLQRHVLSSVVIANPACSYAIGVMHEGKMTLTPLRAMAQFRPDFEHFDKIQARQNRPASSVAAGDAAGAEEASGEEGPVDEGGAGSAVTAAPVRVEYVPTAKAPRGSERGRASHDVAKDAAEDAEEGEPWTRLDHYAPSTNEARDIYEKHLIWPAATAAMAEVDGVEADHPKLQPLEFDSDKATFLAAMCGQAGPSRERRKKAEEDVVDGLSGYMLSRMPAERQVEAVVRHFGVVSYWGQLRKRLPPGTLRTHGKDESLLQLLRMCAVLVAGNWVLKSELAGFEGDEAHARDLLLCLFAKKAGQLEPEGYGKWAEIMAKQGVDRSARDEITRGFVKEHRDQERNLTYRLKNEPDEAFDRRFPELAAEFQVWWERLRTEIFRKLAAGRQGTPGGKGKGKNIVAGAAQQSALSRARAKLLVEVRGELAICAMTQAELRRRIQKKNATVAIRDNELASVLQDPELDAIQIRDLWMLSKTGHATNDKFRHVLHQLFRVRDSVTKQDVMAECERVHGSPCELSDYTVRVLIRELAEKVDGDSYVLKGTMTGGT